jgi:hypothetical protein
MASQPDPEPDRIDPQSPSEAPVAPEPVELPMSMCQAWRRLSPMSIFLTGRPRKLP